MTMSLATQLLELERETCRRRLGVGVLSADGRRGARSPRTPKTRHRRICSRTCSAMTNHFLPGVFHGPSHGARALITTCVVLDAIERCERDEERLRSEGGAPLPAPVASTRKSRCRVLRPRATPGARQAGFVGGRHRARAMCCVRLIARSALKPA
jgi:hypothetical protein